jgi:hypothetical protein
MPEDGADRASITNTLKPEVAADAANERQRCQIAVDADAAGSFPTVSAAIARIGLCTNQTHGLKARFGNATALRVKHVCFTRRSEACGADKYANAISTAMQFAEITPTNAES